jgi:hypothetical protein
LNGLLHARLVGMFFSWSWKSFFLSVESDPTTLDCIAGEEIAEKHEAEAECLLVVGGRKCTA